MLRWLVLFEKVIGGDAVRQGLSTMTIIRTSGAEPDVVINGIVNAEIKRQRERAQMREEAMLAENSTLRKQRDVLAAQLKIERDRPLATVLKRKLVQIKDTIIISICWPWFISLELIEHAKRLAGYDDYDLGYSHERR